MRRKISVITAGCLLVSMISVPAPAKTVKPLKTYHLKQDSVDVVQDGTSCVKLQLVRGKKKVKFSRKTKTEKLSTSFKVTFRDTENGTVSVSKQGVVTATAKRYAVIDKSVGEVTATVTLKKKNKKKWKTYKKKMTVGIYVGDGHIPPTQKPERTTATEPTPRDYWSGYPDWMRPGYVKPAEEPSPTPEPTPTQEPTPRPTRTPKPTPTPDPQCFTIRDDWIRRVPGVYSDAHQLLYTWQELVDMGKVEVEGSTFTRQNFSRDTSDKPHLYATTGFEGEKKEWDCPYCHKHHEETFHSLVIPDTVTKLGDHLFDGCYIENTCCHSRFAKPKGEAKDVTHQWGDSLNNGIWTSEGGEKRWWTYGDFQFQDEIVLPDTLEEIGEYAFHYTTMFSLRIPDGVTKIGAHAFAGSLIHEVKLPSGLEEVGEYAFEDCYNLRSGVLPKTIKKVGAVAFGGTEIGHIGAVVGGGSCYMYEKEIEASRTLDLSNAVEIGECAFSSFGYRTAKWSDTIKEIPRDCFLNLESIEIPDGVTTIGNGAISSHRLKKLKIPSSVTKIGYQCFYEVGFPEIEYDGPGKWYRLEEPEYEYPDYWLE